ncbi:GspH/FimT family pseudopilin [Sedimenticola selenatireducens]|uniref:GspH/FimT family pseudopilin n=1 Tax=Sedimenticola selenatireducens TaxID=191960 RepID=UPI00048BAF31|nr:GspH/FimT family pseudopilin [Sedimenticola selenatireducens]
MKIKGSKHLGFTLIELMITISVAAIILSLAVPSFNFLVLNNRLTTDINRLVTSLNLARSEAVKRGVRVEVAASDGADWRNGWVVWIDANGDGVLDAGEEIAVEQALNPSMVLNSVGGVVSFVYQADGSIVGALDTLNLCDNTRTGETGREITVNVTGRINLNSGFTCP